MNFAEVEVQQMKKRLILGTISCAGILFATTIAVAQTATDADKDFAKKAMEGGNAEVQLGQLAQEKSSSMDVKNFGAKMVTDHSKLNEQMTAVAQNMGVKPETGTSMGDKGEMTKLKMKSGESFDKSYIEEMVKGHRETLAIFKKEAVSAADPQLKSLAGRAVPVISEHLRMAEKLAQNHNVNVASE
jgi:putative membrane protein